MSNPAALDSMLTAFRKAVSIGYINYIGGNTNFSLPRFPENEIVDLCQQALEIFRRDPTLLELSDPVIIVGDLHGHLLDLLRIIYNNGWPPETRYLFLGDIIDRGDFSLETVTMIFLMKVLWPNSVFIIRGNHEFACVCSSHGFSDEICSKYNSDLLFSAYIAAFNELPLAALIGTDILCVHGGIGPELSSLSQIREITKPLSTWSGVSESLLWSDPCLFAQNFEVSKRGFGYIFGRHGLRKFLDANNLRFLIRGHECVLSGISMMFDGSLITIFSASNYCGSSGNRSGIMRIDKGEMTKITYPPLARHVPSSVPPLQLPKKTLKGSNTAPLLATLSLQLPKLRIRRHIVEGT